MFNYNKNIKGLFTFKRIFRDLYYVIIIFYFFWLNTKLYYENLYSS